MYFKHKNLLNIINNKYILAILAILIGYVASNLIMNPNLLLIAFVALGFLFYFRAYTILLIGPLLISKLPSSVEIGGGTAVKIDYLIVLLALWIFTVEGAFGNIKKIVSVNRCIVFFLLIVAANYFRNPSLPSFITGKSSADYIQFGYLVTSLSLLSIYLIVPYILKTTQKIEKVIWVICLFAGTGLVCAYLARLWGIQTPFVHGYGGKVLESQSYYGSFVRYGWLGRYSMILLPVFLVFIKRKSIQLFAIGVILFSIILSGGRADFLSFYVVCAAWIWFTSGKLKTTIVTGVLILISFWALSYEPLLNRFPQLYRFTDKFTEERNFSYKGGYRSDRFGVWQLSIEMIKKHPLIGAGPVSSTERTALKRSLGGLHKEAREGSHATYFNIPAIYGMPALIVYLIGLGAAVISLVKNYNQMRDGPLKRCMLWTLLSIVGFMFSGLFGGRATGGDLYFYFLLGFANVFQTNNKGER
jgi:O-antigen ligase